jgi:hypothetical protein
MAMIKSLPSRHRLAVLFGFLCWASAGLAAASIYAGADGGAAIIGVGFFMSFAGLVGCAS